MEKDIKNANNKRKSTITAQWAIICLGTSIDKRTNQLSIFNIIDDIFLSVGQGISMNLVAKFERSKDLFNFDPFVKLEIIDPDKNKKQIFEDLLKFGKDKKYVRMISSFVSVFPKSGEYYYVISVKILESDKYKEIIRNKINIIIKDSLELKSKA